MITQNQKLFDDFKKVHDAFVKDREAHQAKFNQDGRDVLDMIRFWERKLCFGMEKGVNHQYSSRLAEKFWNEIRKDYSHIDLVGVEITKP